MIRSRDSVMSIICTHIIVGGRDLRGIFTSSFLISMTNRIFVLVSILLAFIVIIVAYNMKSHTRRMRYFLGSVAFTLGGLMLQIGDYPEYAYSMFSLVAPVFTLYFIETERDSEGQTWDGFFWMSLQCLAAALAIIMVSFVGRANNAFIIQYSIVIIMLFFSSKSLRASSGFFIGCIFPISACLMGLLNKDIRFLGFGIMMLQLIVFFGYQYDLEREFLKNQVELSENKVALLMEQMHPHFIYNALQQIALLCDEDPSAVKSSIFSFSSYLRKNLEALTNEKMIPFLTEMEHVDAYVELSQILPSRKSELVKDFAITDFYIPALTVQPLVENAIHYGIGMSEKGNVIRMETKLEGGYVIIRVSDDGHGKRTSLPTQRKHSSVGTKNVITRLKILCDGEFILNLGEKGSEAIIKIPEFRAKMNDK